MEAKARELSEFIRESAVRRCVDEQETEINKFYVDYMNPYYYLMRNALVIVLTSQTSP